MARIREVRQYREMSQRQLADASGMTRMALQHVEAGRRGLKLGEAVVLCAALGVDLGAVVADGPLVLRTVSEKHID